MNATNKTLLLFFAAVLFAATPAMAKTVKVDIHCVEKDVEIDNKGTKFPAWTFGGTLPGPVVRVTEGDLVDFTLVNDEANGHSHSMDFHAAKVDVLEEFDVVKPGSKKNYKFEAKYPGVFMYHCGANNMAQHIAKGMYGIIIVDPKEGFTKNYPKPDREYVLVQSQYFPDSGDAMAIVDNVGSTGSLINGKIFHYDPLHGAGSARTLESKPGELVRIFFVNANVNEAAAFHPIGNVWARVYQNGNPKNVLYGMQTYNVAVSEADTFDIYSPADRVTHNAYVDHNMKAAHHGAITIMTNSDEADPKMGKGDNILPR
ncbi:MAG: multicopper oxidase domain-containing protein [Nitrospinae bacterium]|nr:multicopper oxidase domain-containing protein [Nitrospinota bacterium]